MQVVEDKLDDIKKLIMSLASNGNQNQNQIQTQSQSQSPLKNTIGHEYPKHPPDNRELDQYSNNAPLKVIRKIDYKLFDRLDFYDVLKNDAVSQDLETWLSSFPVGECERLASTF